MIEWEHISLRRGVFWLAVYVVLAVAGLGLFFASGFYNVAASDRHFAISETIIEFVLKRSVAMHSDPDTVPDLSDGRLVALGAKHYAIGCMPCHGSLAQQGNPVVDMMYPAPPALSVAVREWKTEELFWIVMNGLKFTGMPAWAGDRRDDEVWALVAFLERLPDMDEAQYRNLAGASLSQRSQGQGLRFAGVADKTLEFCGSCHGGQDAPPVSGVVPPLEGQHADYLARALNEYRNNQRQSGIMEPIAAALDEEVVAQLVDHYGRRPRIDRRADPSSRPDPERIARGREIVERGLAKDQVPACIACHSGTRSQQFPVLAGMPAAYIESQLEVFRAGIRDSTTYGRVMSVIARRLTTEQIRDAAAYFADMSPAPASNGMADAAGRPR